MLNRTKYSYKPICKKIILLAGMLSCISIVGHADAVKLWIAPYLSGNKKNINTGEKKMEPTISLNQHQKITCQSRLMPS